MRQLILENIHIIIAAVAALLLINTILTVALIFRTRKAKVKMPKPQKTKVVKKVDTKHPKGEGWLN